MSYCHAWTATEINKGNCFHGRHPPLTARGVACALLVVSAFSYFNICTEPSVAAGTGADGAVECGEHHLKKSWSRCMLWRPRCCCGAALTRLLMQSVHGEPAQNPIVLNGGRKVLMVPLSAVSTTSKIVEPLHAVAAGAAAVLH